MRINLLFLFILFIIGSSCKKEYGSFYELPKEQVGQIYDKLAADPELSTFVSAIDKVPGLKEELSSSGLFTVFAPNNESFVKYFASQTQYKKIDDIPVKDLSQLVKYHILKWMIFQSNFLEPGAKDVDIDVYKYETRAVASYFDKAANKAIYYPSKMIQVYTPRYFSYYNVTSQDYTDVYGPASLVNTEIHMNVMGASVIKKDMASANGVIHIVDRVIEPALNIAQELESNLEYEDYNRIMKRRFSSYVYNQAGTRAQGNNGDVNFDGLVDSLFSRSYLTDPNLDNEDPTAVGKAMSYSAFIPSKTAYQTYLNTKLLSKFSNSEDSIPYHTLLLLYKSHLASTMDWPSKVTQGLSNNLLGNKISLSRSEINFVKMTSNGLMYNINKVIEPVAFTTVAGPSFFDTRYWYFAEMLIQTNILNILISPDTKYTLFAPTNSAFVARGIYYNGFPAKGAPGFFRMVSNVETAVSIGELTNLIGNHILMNNSLSVSDMSSSDLHFPTQNGSFLNIDAGKISGSESDTVITVVNPDIHQSNGYFHGINKLIYYPTQSIYDIISSASALESTVPQVNPQYRKFRELVVAAGINKLDFGNITNVAANKKFTCFVPSNEAITAAQIAGKLPKTGTVTPNTAITADIKAKLISYIGYFFVSNQQAFTDGKVTGVFDTKKIKVATPLQYFTLTVSHNGTTLQLTSVNGESAIVDKTKPGIYPQNKIVKDGVIQVINNAFTSQY